MSSELSWTRAHTVVGRRSGRHVSVSEFENSREIFRVAKQGLLERSRVEEEVTVLYAIGTSSACQGCPPPGHWERF